MAYLNWIATTVHGLGMAVGLKNGGDLVTPHNLAALFDFAVVESCAEKPGDCAQYAPFIQAGKPVFAAEYTTAGSGGCPVIKSAATACAVTNAANFEGLIKTCNLGPEYQPCQTYDSNGYRSVPGAPNWSTGSSVTVLSAAGGVADGITVVTVAACPVCIRRGALRAQPTGHSTGQDAPV
ncbi:Glycoside-hydrolase family GH114 TIM-barrel domain-containing protein [Plasmodiophora brassicae]